MNKAPMFFETSMLDAWLEEDVGFFDLTSTLLDVGARQARISWVAREPLVIACTEEVAADNYEDACEAARCGADVVQFDKVEPAQLAQWCSRLRAEWPRLGLLAAGGIRQDNVAAYAATGVDALVTSSLYFGPPADIGVKIEPV